MGAPRCALVGLGIGSSGPGLSVPGLQVSTMARCLQPGGARLAFTQETFEASVTGFSVGDRDFDKVEGGARPPCLSIWINKAANLGKSTLLSPLCLFWPSRLALPQNVQLQGPGGRGWGHLHPPPRGSIGSALKGLTCRRVVDSESLGSWLLVRQAGVWARPGPGPWSHHPLPF